MRLIIIGTLNGQIGAASKIAMDRGAKVTQVDTIDAAMEQLRRGQGADLALVDVLAPAQVTQGDTVSILATVQSTLLPSSARALVAEWGSHA